MPHPDSRTQTRIVKNIVDTIFFTIRGLCREAAQTSCDRSENSPPRILLSQPSRKGAPVLSVRMEIQRTSHAVEGLTAEWPVVVLFIISFSK